MTTQLYHEVYHHMLLAKKTESLKCLFLKGDNKQTGFKLDCIMFGIQNGFKRQETVCGPKWKFLEVVSLEKVRGT